MLSTNSIYFIFFSTGLTIGFGHCIGMCGPIVISLSMQMQGRPSFWPHLFYNIGRTVTYGAMGAVAGGMASFTRFTENIDGFQKVVMIAAGIMIILMGLAMTGLVRPGRLFGNITPLNKFVSAAFKQLLQKDRPVLVYFPLGLLLGLLPCGPVYTALVAAARSGMEAETTAAGVLSGIGIMVCFGLGTIPALLLVSRLTDLGWLRYREKIYRVGAVIMILMGVYFVWQGLNY
ncbi:sulfite exporter TauE/SafE family protein [Thermodesulfobacteriota bacterium]